MTRPDGILIEFYPLGGLCEGFGDDPVTLTEVSIVGDQAAGEDALSRAAMRKLDYVLARRGKGTGRPARTGG